MESPQPVPDVPAKKNQSLLIIVAAAVILCCCCLVTGIVGIYSFTTIRRVDRQEAPVFEATVPADPVESETPPPNPDSPFNTPDPEFGMGDPPEGGLSNEVLRNDTWQYVSAVAMGYGCDDPIGADSTIEVLREPNANGVWLEKWTVVCNSGDSYEFEVEYTLDDTGATFRIISLP